MKSLITTLVFSLAMSLDAGPQPPTGTWRIVCLGDSITQSDSSYRGYRYELWKDLIDAGIPFDFVGSQSSNFGGNPSFPNYQGLAFDRGHEGHWAWDTEDILYGYVCNETQCSGVPGGKLINNWLNGYTPDIALIHLGHNDLFRGWSTSRSVGNLSTIIDTLRADNPNIVVFLCKVIRSSRPSPSSIASLNNGIATLVNKSTAQSPVIIVDQYAGFGSGDLQSDDIHPNNSGAVKIATKYATALIDYIGSNDPPVVEAGANQTLTWPQATTTLSGTVSDDGEPNPPGSVSVQWLQHAGPTAVQVDQPNQLSTTVTLPSGGGYWFKLVANDGEKAATDYVLITVNDGGLCEGQAITVAQSDWTKVEAEAFTGAAAGTGTGATHWWAPVTDYYGISGELVMQTMPDNGVWLGDTAATGPRLDYAVSFPTGGTWYAWVHMYSSGPTRNSIHFGLNGVPITLPGGGVSVDTPYNNWQWIGSVATGANRLTLDVPNRGIHNLNAWAREGGGLFDQMLLTQDPNAVPSGTMSQVYSLGNYCDLDGDALPDSWETLVFGNTLPWPDGDQDGDRLSNVDEYTAGTHPNDGSDFPMLIAEPDGSGLKIMIPSSLADRLYDVAFTRNFIAAEPVWEAVQLNVPGNGGLLTVPHANPPASAVYRYTVRRP